MKLKGREREREREREKIRELLILMKHKFHLINNNIFIFFHNYASKYLRSYRNIEFTDLQIHHKYV